MADREKVIQGLECCIADYGTYDCEHDCPYGKTYECISQDREGVSLQMLCDALELLKAQEQKKKESRAMLPCKCGCKRREHWYGGDDPNKREQLKCERCGFTAYGKNATDVIRNWNKAVSENADS